jgi:hypothetical protein
MVNAAVIPSVSEGPGGAGGAPRLPTRATQPPGPLLTLGMTLGVLVALTVHAETFKVFGSTGAETQLTPANPASPLLRGNTSAVAYQTNSADAVAFIRAGNLHLKLRADSDGSASVGEAFVQFAPRPWLTIAAGRIIEKWGTGYAWNPVAFISPRKNPADPGDRRSSYTGLDMVRADAFVHDTNISLYALEGGQYAARVYRLVRGTDVSLHLTNHQHGLSLARVFGDALELHGEASRRHALAGGQYTFHNNVNIVVELYHGGDGLSASAWRSFCARVDAARDRDALLAANAEYTPLRMARNYAFARVYRPGFIEAELIAVVGLRDRSGLARLTLSRKLRPNLSAYLIDTEFAGRRDSEMAYIQVRRTTTAGVRLYY